MERLYLKKEEMEIHIDLWNKNTSMAPYLLQMLNAKKVLFWNVK